MDASQAQNVARGTAAIALYSSAAQHPRELSFTKGQRLVIESWDLGFEGWCQCRLPGSTSVGLVPRNYIRLVSESDEPPPRPPKHGAVAAAGAAAAAAPPQAKQELLYGDVVLESKPGYANIPSSGQGYVNLPSSQPGSTGYVNLPNGEPPALPSRPYSNLPTSQQTTQRYQNYPLGADTPQEDYSEVRPSAPVGQQQHVRAAADDDFYANMSLTGRASEPHYELEEEDDQYEVVDKTPRSRTASNPCLAATDQGYMQMAEAPPARPAKSRRARALSSSALPDETYVDMADASLPARPEQTPPAVLDEDEYTLVEEPQRGGSFGGASAPAVTSDLRLLNSRVSRSCFAAAGIKFMELRGRSQSVFYGHLQTSREVVKQFYTCASAHRSSERKVVEALTKLAENICVLDQQGELVVRRIQDPQASTWYDQVVYALKDTAKVCAMLVMQLA